jgi:glycosyltransferase involved in cell wall biosynthesis
VLGFVGEARVKKGLAVLLHAFAQIAPQTGARLLLVGGVREKDRPLLDLFLRQHPDLAVCVVPYQTQSHLPDYYHLLDVAVFPSLRDGLPNALLEAMACGCAAVSASVGGIPDVVTDGLNGWLVPPRQEMALVERLRAALADPAGRERIGAAARQTVLDRFTPERELAANLSLYRRLLGLQQV